MRGIEELRRRAALLATVDRISYEEALLRVAHARGDDLEIVDGGCATVKPKVPTQRLELVDLEDLGPRDDDGQEDGGQDPPGGAEA